MFPRLAIAVSLVVTTLCGSSRGNDALDWLPSTVNGVAVVRVREIHDSPLAKKEGWAKKSAQEFLDQQAIVPPGAALLVVGAEFGLSPDLPSLREYGVIQFDMPSFLRPLQDLGFGDVEEVDGHQVLSTPRGGFVIQESNQLWRFTAPGGRQAGMRWMRQPKPAAPQLSDFLTQATGDATSSSEVVVALDLTDALTADGLVASLGGVESLAKLSAAQRSNVLATLASVHGLVLAVNVDSDIQAAFAVEFGQSPAALVPMAEELLRDVLASAGASLESADNWKPTVEGNTIVFRGPITVAEVRLITGLFRGHSISHAGAASANAPATSTGEPGKSDIAYASKSYLTSVSGVLNDLRNTLKRTRDNHALWFEKSARKIDDLPMLNVDADLLDFGQRVSSSLRYQGQSLRTANVRAGVREVSSGANVYTRNYYGYTNYVGPYGGYSENYGSTVQAGGDANAIREQEKGSAKGVQFSEWKQIEDGLVAIRRAMTERYQVEF